MKDAIVNFLVIFDRMVIALSSGKHYNIYKRS